MKNFQHVFTIMMENTGFNTLIGNSNAPFISAAASNYGLATNYFGVTHPSQPNYIAATSGSTNGVSDDSDTTIDVANIVDLCGSLHQLEQHTQCLVKRPLPAGPPTARTVSPRRVSISCHQDRSKDWPGAIVCHLSRPSRTVCLGCRGMIRG
jgi:hypothetical protein